MTLKRPIEDDTVEEKQAGVLVALGLADAGYDRPPTWLVNAVRGICGQWPLVLFMKLCAGVMILLSHRAQWGALLSPVLGFALLSLLVDIGIWMLPRNRLIALAPHWLMLALLPLSAISAGSFAWWVTGLPNIVAAPELAMLLSLGGVVLVAVGIFGSQRILGVAFGTGVAAAICARLDQVTLLPAIATYQLALGYVAVRQARADQRSLVERQLADIRNVRAERMLSEYEESGHGWFWETDRNGRLTYLSEQMASKLSGGADLIGRPFTDLIGPGEPNQGDGGRTLGFHLTARSSFSEIAVRAALARDERWWSISGRPILNEFGQFFGFRGSGTDLTEMQRSRAEVTRLAEYDSLTGLSNRMQMMRTLEQAIVGVGKPGECALFLLDLDRFKSVNDTMGHPAGDALLRQVGQRLQRVVGEKGRVGRLGGDEFKVVLPGQHDRAALAALADRIIDTLSQPYSVEGSQVVIGASIGVAIAPDDGVTTEALIRNADLALYAAKGDGRGVHRFYAPAMHADAEDRRQLEQDLREALATDGLHLEYQPVVSAATERVTGFEALLRWRHPVRGAISPALFVPIAEDAGLISQIGDWVMRTACADAAKWPGDVRVAVNVSPIQFANASLPGTIVNALASAGLDAQRLELEITESVFLNDDGVTEAMFKSLKNVGVRLALDDFGTGYSSLGYLKNAPFDKIKIDQSFVRGASIKGNRNSAIIKSIVSLAEALGMDTTAEGAETHDELELIRSLGCSHIQGYIYGKPMVAEEALRRLNADQGGAMMASGYRASREQRKAMFRTIGVVHGGHRYQARIRNVSAGGALIEGLWHVPNGTRFQLELADGVLVNAESRWSSEDRMGVEFDGPVDATLFGAAPGALRKAG